MTRTNCPSCGALVLFSSQATLATICGSCRSVVRQVGASLLVDAKVSAVVEDASPLCVGTTGRYDSRAFQLVGRLQVKHAQGGFWNEWAVVFDDGRWGWLGEAMGALTMYEPEPAGQRTPITQGFGDFIPGEVVEIGQVRFRVREAGRAIVTGGEGELPCAAGQGWSLPFVDLATHRGEAATIDFSDDTPEVYVGRVVDFEDLAFAGLRESLPADHPMARVANAACDTVNCPSCGGGLERRTGAQAESLHCPYCGAAIDLTKSPFTVFAKNDWSGSLANTTFKIGQKGQLEGVEWVVLGMLERRLPRWDIAWMETLVHNDRRGYRWLVEFQGHYTWVEHLNSVPLAKVTEVMVPAGAGREIAPLDSEGTTRRPTVDTTLTFREGGSSVVTKVAGEFYWKIKAGDTAELKDFVKPPWVMSSEESEGERSWSLGRYLHRDDVARAFGVELPGRWGTVPHQPPPQDRWLKKLWWRWLLAVSAVVLGVIVTAATSKREIVVSDSFIVPAPTDPAVLQILKSDPGSPIADAYLDSLVRWYPAFEVPSGPQALEVLVGTNLNGGWMIAHGSLYDEEKGVALDFQEDISYYAGPDWSEGSTAASVILPSVDTGKYSFRFEPIFGEHAGGDIAVTLSVSRDVPLHRWYGLAFFIVTMPLVWLVIARIAFIARRDKQEEEE